MSGEGSSARLPAHIEVSALVRQVNAAGGFATVLAKGEPDAGTILVVTCCNGKESRLWERMPTLDGGRAWTCSRIAEAGNEADFSDYVNRRKSQDSDLWIVELDIAQGERFIGLTPADS
jgi:hypothetical protein